MASKSKGAGKVRGGGRPRSWRLFRFFLVPPGLYLILVTGAAALIWWKSFEIGFRITALVRGVSGLFGWGLILVVAGLIAVVAIIRMHKTLSALRHANWWLGAISFMLAAWGILALLGIGGSIGVAIIGRTVAFGVLRVIGLIVLSVGLIAPVASFNAIKASVGWLAGRFRGPVRLPMRPEIPPPAFVAPPPKVADAEPPPEKPKNILPALGLKKKAPPAVPSTPEQLREVASDVWKKYGEAPDGIIVDGWRLPPVDILEKSPEVQFSQADNQERAKRIEEALASYGVEGKVVQINTGPTVTQFGIEPGWDRKTREVKEKDKEGHIKTRTEEVSRMRVKVDRITSLSNDLSLALSAPSIRIEAPVPGKSIVGVEVPNTSHSLVSLRGVIESSAFQKVQGKGALAIALGMGAGGEAVAADLAKMPHLLIAGSTGSGKTVCLNAIICCLLINNTPNDARFIMIDPKRVELTTFNSIPHLAMPVIVEADKAVIALRGLAQEMNKRYQTLASAGCRNIEAFNKGNSGKDRMPYLVLVIDELADLMMTAGNEVEQILCRLAQLARAVGIHLVVATQRPSVDVVTGLIKANFPTRLSFAVTSQVDSRTILDMVGAEKLLGSGDMLFMPTEAAKPKRLQGCYVSDAEAERLVFFWNSQHKGETPPLLKIEDIARAAGAGRNGQSEDSLLEEARQLALEHEHISTSFLQRRLHIGYPRAARLYEQLQEEMGEDVGDEDE